MGRAAVGSLRNRTALSPPPPPFLCSVPSPRLPFLGAFPVPQWPGPHGQAETRANHCGSKMDLQVPFSQITWEIAPIPCFIFARGGLALS